VFSKQWAVGSGQWAVGSEIQKQRKKQHCHLSTRKKLLPAISNSLNIPKQEKTVPLSEIYLSCPFDISEINVFHKYKTGERKRSPQVTLLI